MRGRCRRSDAGPNEPRLVGERHRLHAVAELELRELALRSTAASRWLVRLGVVAGGTVALAGLVSSAGAGTHGSVHGVGDALSGIGIAAFWLWLVATGIALWRAAPQTERRRLTFRRTADPVGSRG